MTSRRQAAMGRDILDCPGPQKHQHRDPATFVIDIQSTAQPRQFGRPEKFCPGAASPTITKIAVHMAQFADFESLILRYFQLVNFERLRFGGDAVTLMNFRSAALSLRLSSFVAVFVGVFVSALSIASAANLTPAQRAIVEKYNISQADQEILFGGQALAHEGRFGRSAANTGEESPSDGILPGAYVWLGADTFKSVGDRITNINGGTGALTGSFGAVGGVNAGLSLGSSNIGLQAGASFGVYDPKGRLRIVPDSTAPETQAFVTAGVYRRSNMSKQDTTFLDRISGGIVVDHLIGKNYGVNANDISLSQVRGIVGVALNESTEVGVWGTVPLNTDMAAVTVAGAPGVRREIRAMTQGNLYLKHNFDFGGTVSGYVGILDGADIGKWQVGLNGQMPLSDSWSTYASANYVVPHTASGPIGSGQEQFSASFGLSYYFGGKASSQTVSGRRELPLLDVASNRTFLITD